MSVPARARAERDLTALALAVALDALFGEPPSAWHPVAVMGRLIAAAERRAPRTPLVALGYGAGVALGGTVACALFARAMLAATEQRAPGLHLALIAILLKTTFAVRALDEAAEAVAEPLSAGDLPAARHHLRSLVSRDPTSLDARLVAAAAVESVAENLGDSFVAPLLWYGVLGLPGAVAYRFANTCDAMLGYRGRYEYLGKAAARLDDALSWLPSRLAACALVVAAPVAGADARGAWRTMREHHGRTASPNAGWPMSAAAGALGVRLEKHGHYTLGRGPRPDGAGPIRAAVALTRTAATLAFGAYVATALVRRCHAAAG